MTFMKHFTLNPKRGTRVWPLTIISFDAFVDEGTILHNYAHVFDLLLRLRQAVDHPYLVLHSKERGEEAHQWCKLCHEESEDPIESNCKHTFCRGCITNYVQTSKDTPGCPECNVPLTIDLNQKTVKCEKVMLWSLCLWYVTPNRRPTPARRS